MGKSHRTSPEMKAEIIKKIKEEGISAGIFAICRVPDKDCNYRCGCAHALALVYYRTAQVLLLCPAEPRPSASGVLATLRRRRGGKNPDFGVLLGHGSAGLGLGFVLRLGSRILRAFRGEKPHGVRLLA